MQWSYCSNGSLFKAVYIAVSDVCNCCSGRWSVILNPYFKTNYHWSVLADYGLLGNDLWTLMNDPGSYVWFLDIITAIFSQNSITGTTLHHRNTCRYRHVTATSPLSLQCYRPGYWFWYIFYGQKNIFIASSLFILTSINEKHHSDIICPSTSGSSQKVVESQKRFLTTG